MLGARVGSVMLACGIGAVVPGTESGSVPHRRVIRCLGVRGARIRRRRLGTMPAQSAGPMTERHGQEQTGGEDRLHGRKRTWVGLIGNAPHAPFTILKLGHID